MIGGGPSLKKHNHLEMLAQSDYQGTAKITFTKTLGDIPERNSGLYISDKMFEYQDMSGEVYEKVRRQNRIVKTVTGTVTVARGT